MRRCGQSGGCNGHTHSFPRHAAALITPLLDHYHTLSSHRPLYYALTLVYLSVSYCSIGPGWWLSPRAKRGLTYHSIAHPSCKITAPLASAASTEVRIEEATHALTRGLRIRHL